MSVWHQYSYFPTGFNYCSFLLRFLTVDVLLVVVVFLVPCGLYMIAIHILLSLIVY